MSDRAANVREFEVRCGQAVRNATAALRVAARGQQQRTIPANTSTPSMRIDTDALPALLREYLQTLSRVTEADESMILGSLVCCASAFIGTKLYFPRVGQNAGYPQDLFPNIWNLSIAPSGCFKSTALKLGTEIAEQFENKMEINISGLRPYYDDRILLPNLLTTAALLEGLEEKKGNLILCSEFSTWFDSLTAGYNVGLQNLFLELYDVPARFEKRTTSTGRTTISYPFISICGVTTPSWINTKITASEITSGFLARFLIFYPQISIGIPPALPKPSAQNDGKLRDRVFEILMSIKDGKQRKMYLSNNAKDLFETYHDQIYERVGLEHLDETTMELVMPFLKRWSPYLLKLAIINQIFIDHTSDEISTEALKGAKAILDFAITSTKRLLEHGLGESEYQKKERKIIEKLKKKGGTLDWRTLTQSKVLKGGASEYESVIKSMESAGLIGIIRDGKRIKGIELLSDNQS